MLMMKKVEIASMLQLPNAGINRRELLLKNQGRSLTVILMSLLEKVTVSLLWLVMMNLFEFLSVYI